MRMRQFCPEVPTEVALRLVEELGGVRAALPGGAGGAAGEGPGHRRRKGNRLEPGGEEEACQGDRVDPASLRREECEEVQLRAVGQGGHCGGYFQDLLEEDTFGYLAGLAAEGRTEGVTGGPPCRKYSCCRHFEPGPYPVRGRGEERFGYEELSDAEARKVEGDSVLMLRMWILAAGSWWV